MVEKIKNKKIKIGSLALLWSLFTLAILANLSTLNGVLNRMLTFGDPLPLQSFLNRFVALWDIVDAIWTFLITSTGYDYLMYKYAWGGFTIALLIKAAINHINSTAEKPVLTERETFGRRLNLLYIILILSTIIFGLNRDNWIPYAHQPEWEVNLVNKQQISAGSYMIILIYIYFHGLWQDKKGYEGSLKFYNNPKILTYMFAAMMLENFGSFDFFPDGLGYEEIMANPQSFVSFDKVFHFFISSATAVFLLMNIKNRKLVVAFAVFGVAFWELFEFVLNTSEALDAPRDMIINTSAIVLTAIFLNKFEWKPKKLEIEMKEPEVESIKVSQEIPEEKA